MTSTKFFLVPLPLAWALLVLASLEGMVTRGVVGLWVLAFEMGRRILVA